MAVNSAFKNTQCEVCGDMIEEGDSIYFNDDGKLCEDCGEDAGIVCPECRGNKKPDFDKCFTCNQKTADIEIIW